jgi:hypothetical protein
MPIRGKGLGRREQGSAAPVNGMLKALPAVSVIPSPLFNDWNCSIALITLRIPGIKLRLHRTRENKSIASRRIEKESESIES